MDVRGNRTHCEQLDMFGIHLPWCVQKSFTYLQ